MWQGRQAVQDLCHPEGPELPPHGDPGSRGLPGETVGKKHPAPAPGHVPTVPAPSGLRNHGYITCTEARIEHADSREENPRNWPSLEDPCNADRGRDLGAAIGPGMGEGYENPVIALSGRAAALHR